MGCQVIAQLPCTIRGIGMVKSFKHFQSNIKCMSVCMVWNVVNDRYIEKKKMKNQLKAYSSRRKQIEKRRPLRLNFFMSLWSKSITFWLHSCHFAHIRQMQNKTASERKKTTLWSMIHCHRAGHMKWNWFRS